jgi:hypothetical protein
MLPEQFRKGHFATKSHFISVFCTYSTLCHSWQRACYLYLQFMRLASRGGRDSTSTEFSVIGGSHQYRRGLAPAPFLFFSCLWSSRQRSEFPYVCRCSSSVLRRRPTQLPQKSERPVGVPAALAWGMEGLLSEAQFFSGGAGSSTALASSRKTHRSKITTIIPPTPGLEPNSRQRH